MSGASETVLLMSLIVFFPCLIHIFWKVNLRTAKFIEKAKARGYCVEGNVIGTEPCADGRVIVTYQYFVNGSLYKKKLMYGRPGRISVEFPHVIEIYYNPKHPEKGVCQDDMSQSSEHRMGCLMILVLSLLSFGALYFAMWFLLSLLFE